MHFIYIVGLVICCQYSLGFPTGFGKHDLVARKTADENARFFVLGDWGGVAIDPYVTPSELAVAHAMGKIGEKLNTSFQLALGDNFYYHGVKNVDDPRFKDTFEDVFTAESLQTPWYVLAGNHDHLGNVSAQIEYSKRSKRWNFPDYFYTFSLWQNSQQTKLIDFVMLDTVILCGGGNASDSEDTPLSGPANEFLAETYWQWVEEQFRQSNAPYLLVSGHFPVYSVAEHGPTKCLVERLQPLLHQYRATAYLCGHDHNLQHLSDSANGTQVDYFVVGAADVVQDSHAHAGDVPSGVLKYFWGDGLLLGGFGMIEANTSQLTFSFIKHTEHTLYQTTLKPRL